MGWGGVGIKPTWGSNPALLLPQKIVTRMLCRVFPQLGLPIRVLTVSQSNEWLAPGGRGPGFPEGCASSGLAGFPGPPEPGSPPQSQKSKIAFGTLNCQKMPTVQKSKSPKVKKSKSRKFPKSKSPKVQKSRSPKVQKSKVQKSKSPKVQKSKRTKIQKSKSPKVQK